MDPDLRVLSVVCPAEDYGSFFSFLEEYRYELRVYHCLEHATQQDQYFTAPVTVIDIDKESTDCFNSINTIHEKYPEIRVILTGDFRNSSFPENIPRIFHFLRKPFSSDKLSAVLDNAFAVPFGVERRREPRVALNLPVDLCYRSSFLKARTGNISLHGMQALLYSQDDIGDLVEKHEQGDSPVTACRLFLCEDENENRTDAEDHLNIPMKMRYIKEGEPAVLGFEFRDLDLDLRSKLVNVVIW